MAQNINQAFRQLGRTEKAQFVERNLGYASGWAIAGYVEAYFFRVAKHLSEETLMAMLHYKQEKSKSDETAGN